MSAHEPNPHLADIRRPLRRSLYRITERLAGELAQPASLAPDWSPTEWRLARAVAVIHCVSPLLSGTLRWEGPQHWAEFLASQKAHVLARQHRILEVLEQMDLCCRQSGIAAVALKGAALHSLGLYRPGERPMADIDLLVHPADTQRTGRMLRSIGFSESFTSWNHEVFTPKVCNLHRGLGEHADNYLKVELHARIAEKLPVRITDVTDSIYPSAPHPGLNAYPSNAALMTHLLIHAAGSMTSRSLRLLHLHDIALVCARMSGSDWQNLLPQGANGSGLWWALPPLQLTARYYPDAVPAAVLAALSEHCPWTLRYNPRHRHVSDVSMSYPWIEAFPGIVWSRSFGEIVEFIGDRLWPNKEMRRLRTKLVETELAASQTTWGRLSQTRRMLKWLTGRPVRIDTLHAVRMALAKVISSA